MKKPLLIGIGLALVIGLTISITLATSDSFTRGKIRVDDALNQDMAEESRLGMTDAVNLYQKIKDNPDRVDEYVDIISQAAKKMTNNVVDIEDRREALLNTVYGSAFIIELAGKDDSAKLKDNLLLICAKELHEYVILFTSKDAETREKGSIIDHVGTLQLNYEREVKLFLSQLTKKNIPVPAFQKNPDLEKQERVLSLEVGRKMGVEERRAKEMAEKLVAQIKKDPKNTDACEKEIRKAVNYLFRHLDKVQNSDEEMLKVLYYGALIQEISRSNEDKKDTPRNELLLKKSLIAAFGVHAHSYAVQVSGKQDAGKIEAALNKEKKALKENLDEEVENFVTLLVKVEA